MELGIIKEVLTMRSRKNFSALHFSVIALFTKIRAPFNSFG
jgi:hypothetical protein